MGDNWDAGMDMGCKDWCRRGQGHKGECSRYQQPTFDNSATGVNGMKFSEADMRAALEVMKLMRDNSADLFSLLVDVEFAKKIAQIIAAARKKAEGQ